jgi:hypothetical protein
MMASKARAGEVIRAAAVPSIDVGIEVSISAGPSPRV